MKLRTFYKIYYEHRFKKANFILKFYIIIVILFKYVITNYPKKINLDSFSKNHKELFNRDFDYLCKNFNTDKGSYFIDQFSKNNSTKKIAGHNYSTFYENIFFNIKDNIKSILEIGSFKGNAIAVFYFYFKNSKIISTDLYPDLFLYESNRIRNFLLDASSEISISTFKEKLINFDLIIDDASHYLKDQIISLFLLFNRLNSGGYFIIEELDFPDTRHDMNINNEAPSLREILISIKNNKDFNSKFISSEDKKYLLNNYDSISILKGRFNEIAFIKKK
ncbi:hypothetical protein [Candidatus Fonsibacter ubiquis]|uniref:hypothetical protein n=1 Tax=Candidatus Fonsibacter ubiquis TaxID=1925548 RepID=UPI000C070592|nr:hypothetical protein [Candidatus Fonsibacter ubiquis]